MTEQSNTTNSAPLWNGWAMGMFAGLLALSGIFFGWTKTIHLDNRWAHLSSEFQATCRDQEVLAAVIDDLIEGNDGNRELRAEFRQLELRTYPAAEVDVLGIDPPTYDADSVTRVFPELVALRQYSCETPPAPHAPSVFTDEG
jgi:hypothetical protein